MIRCSLYSVYRQERVWSGLVWVRPCNVTRSALFPFYPRPCLPTCLLEPRLSMLCGEKRVPQTVQPYNSKHLILLLITL